MIRYLFFLLFLVPVFTMSQKGTPVIEESSQNEQKQAEFPGGMDALMKFVMKTMRYPASCEKNNIQGKVYVEFIINENGKVSDAKIKKGVHVDLDNEALRIVSVMPDWEPAVNNSKIVKQKFVLPINFKLH